MSRALLLAGVISIGMLGAASPGVQAQTVGEKLTYQTSSILPALANSWGSSSWEVTGDVLHIGPGVLPSTSLGSVPWYSQRNSITSVVFDDPANTAFSSNASYMFDNLSKVTSISGIGQVNTSSVTDMYAMFTYASSLSSLDVSGWDTSNVTDMGDMFSGASSLSSLDVSGWDTSHVFYMNSMFYGASSLSSLDLSGWDTSNVTSMYAMFTYASSLSSLDVSGWDTSSVTSMSSMFYGASALSVLVLGENTKLTDEVALPDPSASAELSGNWVGVGAGSIEVPQGPWTGSSMDLYANSRLGEANTYVWQRNIQVLFDANNGEGTMSSLTNTTGNPITIPDNMFTRSNYNFVGWNTAADGSGQAYLSGAGQYLPGGTVTLYAQWQPIAPTPTPTPTDPAPTATNGTGNGSNPGNPPAAAKTALAKTGINATIFMLGVTLLTIAGAASYLISRKRKQH